MSSSKQKQKQNQKHQGRPYQLAAVEAVHQCWEEQAEGEPHPMLVMATGTGKTFTAMLVIRGALENGLRVLWLAHREELLAQAVKAAGWSSSGIIQGSQNAADKQFVAASVATLRNDKRVTEYLSHGAPAIVVVDECHHSPSPTHTQVMEAVSTPGVRMLGLTATPDREDGGDLSEHWQIVYSYPIDQAVDAGFLSPPFAAFRGLDIDMDAIAELDDEEMGAELVRQGIVDATVAAVKEAHHFAEVFGDAKEHRSIATLPGLVFTASVEQARLTAEALTAAGIESRYICGTTSKGDRRRLLRAFEKGLIQYICNPSVLTEGTDLPRAAVGVLARPLRSWSLYVQCCGRAMRLHSSSPRAYLVDLGGSTRVHDLVSAPVLIGGSKCLESTDGVHSFKPHADGIRGECEHCGKRVACFARLGPHQYDTDTHRCVTCDTPQCPESGTSAHTWVPLGIKRQCIDCGVEVSDPHAGMLRPGSKGDVVDADWTRIHGLTPEVYMVDAGEAGQVYVVGHRQDEEWDVYWLKKGGRKVRRVGNEGQKTPSNMVRRHANNIVMRARRMGGDGPATPRQRERCFREGIVLPHGATSAEASKLIAVSKAKAKCIKYGLAEPC